MQPLDQATFIQKLIIAFLGADSKVNVSLNAAAEGESTCFIDATVSTEQVIRLAMEYGFQVSTKTSDIAFEPAGEVSPIFQ